MADDLNSVNAKHSDFNQMFVTLSSDESKKKPTKRKKKKKKKKKKKNKKKKIKKKKTNKKKTNNNRLFFKLSLYFLNVRLTRFLPFDQHLTFQSCDYRILHLTEPDRLNSCNNFNEVLQH